MNAIINIAILWAAIAAVSITFAVMYKDTLRKNNNYVKCEKLINAATMWLSIGLYFTDIAGMQANLYIAAAILVATSLVTLVADRVVLGDRNALSAINVVKALLAPVLVTLCLAAVPKRYVSTFEAI